MSGYAGYVAYVVAGIVHDQWTMPAILFMC